MPRGMILAAGRGVRLGELTALAPKPLLPVANRPVMAQGIDSLRRGDIDDICVNVSYRARQIIDALGDGRDAGVRLHWSVEETATGTAGGLKGCAAQLGGHRVVVIAGDAVLDVGLRPLLAAHAAHGAFATLATLEVPDPSLYGVVEADAAGRILRFQEKPVPGTEISHHANTGIYIFEPGIFDLIPPGAFCDFALDIFPEILRRGLPFFAVPVQGYWRDIGNPGDYLRANMDYLAGHMRIHGCGTLADGNLLGAGAVTAGARLCRCVVGAGAVIPAGSALTECVVWPGAALAEPLTLRDGIITPEGAFAVRDKTALALAASGVTG